MVIMGLLAGLAVPNVTRSLQAERLRTGARTMANMVQIARSRAITHHTYTRLSLDTDEGIVTIEQLQYPTDSNGSAVAVSTTTAAAGVGAEPTWEELTDSLARRRALPQGVRITYAGAPSSQVSTAQSRELTFAPDGSTDDAVIRLEGYKQDRLTVSIRRLRLNPTVLSPEEEERLLSTEVGR